MSGLVTSKRLRRTGAIIAAAGACSVALAPAAFAAGALANGGFESFPAGAPVTTVTTANYSSYIAPWRVDLGNVDLVRSDHWTPFEGTQSLNLEQPGKITQSIATVAGHQYEVDFEYAADPDGGNRLTTLRLSFDGVANQTYTATSVGATPGALGWKAGSLVATAPAGNQTTVTFAEQDAASSPYGTVIDAVRVTDITASASLPEAPMASLLALAGMTVVGGVTLARRRQAG